MLWVIAVTILAVILLSALSKKNESLKNLPGPLRLPFIGTILTQPCSSVCTSDNFEKFLGLYKLYGSRFLFKSFNRYILHIYNPKDVEIVLTHSRNISKHKGYKFMVPWLGTGLLISTGSKWQKRRKVLTPTFHFEILKNFAKVMENQSRKTIEILNSKIGIDGRLLNVIPFLTEYSLNVICETAMGTRLDAEEMDCSKLKYKESIFVLGVSVIQRLKKIWQHSDFIFNLTPAGKAFRNYLDEHHRFTDNIISERKKQRDESVQEIKCVENQNYLGDAKRKLALLDLLLDAESKGEIDIEGIREEVNTFTLEGYDTTSAALMFGLNLIADHEEVQDRLYEECKGIFGDSMRTADPSELAQMKYLEAVVKEILRLYPSVPFIGRTIDEDFMLDDLRVPKGTEVVVHIFDMHHREDLFPEPYKFQPERFLSGEKTNFSYVPFSAGPRNCIGQRFAMQTVKYLISDVIRHFKLYPKTRGHRPKIKADIMLRADEPIYVKFSKR
ncbi:cytochrome P450 4C1-like [Leptidea sinapis]|uniref:cytochrome P450 4C1-like n=1 Tax=Leptidea sinapis TaxID=189913 RepID=UPI002139562B|nr:cytochrome P450 4C1-like [Leptidea sinapis]